jgi:hypothetical protein
VVLCKTFEAITRERGFVLSYYFYVLSNGSPMWSWDWCGSENFEKKKEASGFKRDQSNLTP